MKIFSLLQYIRCIPHLLIWKLDENKSIIDYDVDVWRKQKNIKSKLNMSFLQLLNTYPEFRNLFYYRIGTKAIFLNFLYRKCSSLFLSTPEIGPGLYIQHGFATIIAAKKIGKDCFINQQVTIGYTESDKSPTLGDNVRVAAGAKVLGDIFVGNHVIIGANAVVVKDVPDNCTIVGIPAYIIKKDGKRVTLNLNDDY